MSVSLLGRKLGMTQIFSDQGEWIPVTVIKAGPCVVVQKKTEKGDGYTALQLGFEERKEKHTTKAMKGHFAKSGVSPRRHLFEIRVDAEEAEGIELGTEIRCGERFQDVAKVDVTGTTIGRGFTGVVKLWGFKTHSQTHGTHEFFRHGGAMSSGTYPGRIWPGKKMAGHYGNEEITTQGLTLVRVDAERDLLFVKGAVPGHRNGLVSVRPSLRT